MLVQLRTGAGSAASPWAVTDGSVLVPHTILLEPEALKFLFLFALHSFRAHSRSGVRERGCACWEAQWERLTEPTSKMVRGCVRERECAFSLKKRKIGDRGETVLRSLCGYMHSQVSIVCKLSLDCSSP